VIVLNDCIQRVLLYSPQTAHGHSQWSSKKCNWVFQVHSPRPIGSINWTLARSKKLYANLLVRRSDGSCMRFSLFVLVLRETVGSLPSLSKCGSVAQHRRIAWWGNINSSINTPSACRQWSVMLQQCGTATICVAQLRIATVAE
jgi:hypothetical protein